MTLEIKGSERMNKIKNSGRSHFTTDAMVYIRSLSASIVFLTRSAGRADQGLLRHPAVHDLQMRS